MASEFLFFSLILGIPLLVTLLFKQTKKVMLWCAERIAAIEKIKASLFLWVVSLFSIMLLRDYLENFMQPLLPVYPPFQRIEYFLFWIPIFLTLCIFIALLSKERLLKVAKAVTFLWAITLLPPIIDFIISAGKGISMAYISGQFHFQYFSFMNLFSLQGPATIGIKIEILLACMFSILYVFVKTKSIWKAAIAPLIVYSTIFFYFITPRFIPLLRRLGIMLPFDGSMIIIHGLLVSLLVLLWIFLLKKEKLRKEKKELERFSLKKISIAFYKNISVIRHIHFSFLGIIGFLIAVSMARSFSMQNIFSLLFLLIALFFAWLFAVCLNDYYDRDIDKVSNAHRPLASAFITGKENKLLTLACFIIALFFSLLAGYVITVFIFFFMLVYGVIYSAPPFRLRRYFLIPNILIGLAHAAVLMAGFSILFQEFAMILFPINILAFALIFFTFGSMMKDAKDFEGDKQNNIHTLFTLFGLKKGKIICGLILFACGFITLFFFSTPFLLVICLVFSTAGFIAMVKSNEKTIFFLEFLFIFSIILLMAFTVSAEKLCEEKIYNTPYYDVRSCAMMQASLEYTQQRTVFFIDEDFTLLKKNYWKS
ncbi:hypothetical protein C4573_00150 [Candidatus Woesearchaeota archaeon]|nr:MAG: hypothetical protein C4573_00150 [Candidatus Woesearchaeota archaeon]